VTAAPNTLLSKTESIALDFLHSVVLIDDRVFVPSAAEEAIATEPLEELQAPGRRGAAPVEESDASPKTAGTSTDHPLNAKPLIDRFAEQGLVCAVLRADSDDDIKRTGKAAQRADIVVLDWKINAVYGDTTLQLIRDIVGSGDRDRLRLIAIYTGENTLNDISTRVRDELDAIVGNKYQHKKDDLYAVTRGPVRIVVYAKADTMLPTEDEKLHDRITGPHELPDRLLAEFAQMTSGLVSNVALDALARLRASMHRILLRLHPGLDAAYLCHRALVIPPEEAEEHLVALVAAEIAGILEESGVGRHADVAAIRLWLQDRMADGANFAASFGFNAEADPLTELCAILEQGIGHQALPKQLEALKSRKQSRTLTERFCTPATDAVRRDSEFAMLVSLRERYATRPPYLTLGTILMSGATEKPSYWLCVQPACDSLRLREKRPFPMLPLAVVSGDQPFDVIVMDGAEVVKLKASAKPYDQQLATFSPDAASHTVKPTVDDKGSMTFKAEDGVVYRWIGELKPDHAQRFLQRLGSEQGRVGVVESEWMQRSRPSS